MLTCKEKLMILDHCIQDTFPLCRRWVRTFPNRLRLRIPRNSRKPRRTFRLRSFGMLRSSLRRNKSLPWSSIRLHCPIRHRNIHHPHSRTRTCNLLRRT
jgi:hypothetical protein